MSASHTVGAFGCVLVVIGAYCFCPSVFAQAPDSRTADQPNNSWTATTDVKGNDLNSARIIENHTQTGNRTLDERSVQIRSSDGHFEHSQDIERETLQVDATTVRTISRAFGHDLNGSKTLVLVTEEEKHTLADGDSKLIRVTSNPNVKGEVQEIVETKMVSTDVEETKTTVMLPNANGGLVPAFKRHELRNRAANNTIESQTTTVLPDGAGNGT